MDPKVWSRNLCSPIYLFYIDDLHSQLLFHTSGSGKKTAAHVVADVLFDFGLIPSRECVITSVQSIASSVRELKAGILVIEVSKRYDWYSELDDAMQWEDLVETSLIIVAGDYSDIDFGSAMETRSEVKKLFRHSFDFDFGSWDERDCVGLFERHAR